MKIAERLQGAFAAGLAANGVHIPAPGERAPVPVAAPAPAKKPKRLSSGDRVVFLGSCGMLVRTSDGRLPRDGEVELDGAAVRVSTRVGPVLVVGALRSRPADGKFRWATATELHPLDLEIVRTVAPSQCEAHEACLRINDLARQLIAAAAPAVTATGIIETDLRTAVAVLQARAVCD